VGASNGCEWKVSSSTKLMKNNPPKQKQIEIKLGKNCGWWT
jgi:hypothetical protein